MFRIFNRTPRPKPHEHDWELVAVNREYSTTYTDTGEVKKWEQRFYKCSCGKRSHKDNRPSYSEHEGIESAKQNWIEAGVVPVNSFHPSQSSSFIKADDLEVEEKTELEKLTGTINDFNDILKITILRDLDLESRYPKLKEAADNYKAVLDKYKTFESLKE